MSRYLKGRDYALKLVAAQFALSLLMGAVGSAVTQKVGLSLMIGGAISVAANTWMALVAFRPQLSAPVAKMLIAFYLGEMGKFVVTALLFLLAFKTDNGYGES